MAKYIREQGPIDTLDKLSVKEVRGTRSRRGRSGPF